MSIAKNQKWVRRESGDPKEDKNHTVIFIKPHEVTSVSTTHAFLGPPDQFLREFARAK